MMLTFLSFCFINCLWATPGEAVSHVSTMGNIQEGLFPKLVHRYYLSDSVRMKRKVYDHPLRNQEHPSVLVPILDEVYLAILYNNIASLDLNHDGVIQPSEEVELVATGDDFRGTIRYSTLYQENLLDIHIVFISTDPQNNLGFLHDMMRSGTLWDGTPFFLHSYAGNFNHPRAEVLVDADNDGKGDIHNKLLRVRMEKGELSWKGDLWSFYSSPLGEEVRWKKKGASVLQEGKTIPDFSLVDVKGEIQSLDGYKGKKLLLDFWATWCAACIQDHKKIVNLKKKYQLEILGFAQNTEKEVVQYLKKNKLSWSQIALAEEHPILSLFQIQSLPTYILVDEEGALLFMGQLEHIEEILAQ